MSASVLRLFATGDKVAFTKVPWRQDGDVVELNVNSLGSRVLCQGHNSRLARLDDMAMGVFEVIQSHRLTDNRVMAVDGFDFERWMLKVTCGLFAAHADWMPPRYLLDVLFGQEVMGHGAGLLAVSYKGVRPMDGIDFGAVNDQDGTLVALTLTSGCVSFIFSLVPTPSQLTEIVPGRPNAHYRIGRIVRELQNGFRWVVDFGWGDDTLRIREHRQ